MHISNDQVKKALQSYVQRVESKKPGKVDAKSRIESVLPKADSVTITAGASEINKAKELYEKLPDVREDLVKELKGKVDSGTYKPTSQEMADKILYRTIVDKTI